MRRCRYTAMLLLTLAMSCGSEGESPTGPGGNPPINPVPSAWVWQNPLPHGNSYRGVAAVGGGHAIAITESDVTRTTDGGNSWEHIPFGQTFFVDIHDRGDLVTILDAGFVHFSTDDGATWRRSTSGHRIAREAHAFWDDKNGVVVGSSGSCVTTSDGGDSWIPRFTGSEAVLADVEYLDSLTVFAVGGDEVFRSRDGGRFWESLDVPGAFVIYAIDITDGVIRVTDHLGAVFISVDQGESWSRVSINGGVLRDLDFADVVNGIMAGDGGRIHVTRNGGSNWFPSNPDVTTNMTAVARTADDMWAAGEDGEIHRATNGFDWQALRTGPTFDAYSVSFASPDIGMVVGPGCGLLSTNNGGESWVPGRIPSAISLCTVGDLFGVHMIDESNVVVVGEGGMIWRTSNRGLSWTRGATSTFGDLVDVAFGDSTNGVAVGEGGALYHTTDSGATWSVFANQTVEDLTSVSFASPNVAMFVGANGTAQRTLDGGATWEPMAGGFSSFDFHTIEMVNETTAFAAAIVDRSFAVIRTVDGGKNWQDVDLIRNPLSFSFESDLRGYGVGNFGQFMITKDGGASWTYQRRMTLRHMRDVVAIAPGIVTIVGDGGSILRSITGGE